MSRHSYRTLGRPLDEPRLFDEIAPQGSHARHSYQRLAATLEDLKRPRIALVPALLEALPAQHGDPHERFSTDPNEAHRVVWLLAPLFARAAEKGTLTRTMRKRLGLTDEQASAIAKDIGRRRAAEVMGFMWTDAGDLVPDPDAEKSITAVTESQVNEAVDEVVAGFQVSGAPVDEAGLPQTWQEGHGPNDAQPDASSTGGGGFALAIAGLYAFDAQRPAVVSDYETARLRNMFALAAYEAAGVTQVRVRDGIEFDVPCILANGEKWSIAQALMNPLEHPGCQRSFIPLFESRQAASARPTMRLYSEDQSRDENGRWDGGGGGGAGATQHGPSTGTGSGTPGGAMPREMAQAAQHFGFSADKMVYEQGQGPRFTIGDKEFISGGNYNPNTGVITMYGETALDPSYLAHEIEHAKFDAVTNEYPAEIARLTEHTYDSAGHRVDELAKSDGVSDYSKAYWQEYEKQTPGTVGAEMARRLAINETLAEISRLGTKGGVPLTLRQEQTTPWGKLYQGVDRLYAKHHR
jgi:hypothetical protein